MDKSLLTNLLNIYIRKAFENEKAFLGRFWVRDTDELSEFYMASERCRMNIMLVEHGKTMTTTIRTDEFLEWADSI